MDGGTTAPPGTGSDLPRFVRAEGARRVDQPEDTEPMLDPDMRVQAAAGSDTAVAFALFQHIADKDPASVAAKDDAIAVFRECMEAVGLGDGASHEPRPIRLARE